jgi:D-amino-acid dehydrogenase
LHQRGIAVTVLDAGPAERAASHVNAGWIVPTLAEPVPSPGLIATSLRWMLRSDSPLYIRPRLDPAFLRWTFRFWRHCNARDFLAGTEAIAAFGARSLGLYDAMQACAMRSTVTGSSSPTAAPRPSLTTTPPWSRFAVLDSRSPRS